MKEIYCFGEVLWDELEGNSYPGGAPFNVAYHLSKLQQRAFPVSRAGRDKAGKELLEVMEQESIPTRYVQRDPLHATGRVEASRGEGGEIHYRIIEPVAWDFIRTDPDLIRAMTSSSVLVYGSLAARGAQSYRSLLSLLPAAGWRVMDCNLRPPYYQKDSLSRLLSMAQLLKLNHQELGELLVLFQIPCQSAEPWEQARAFREHFSIPELLLTLGAEGAGLLSASGRVCRAGFTVKVQDTIGCGDSFLAAFLHARLAGRPNDECLHLGLAMGAFIAQRKGGCPEYSLSEFLSYLRTLPR